MYVRVCYRWCWALLSVLPLQALLWLSWWPHVGLMGTLWLWQKVEKCSAGEMGTMASWATATATGSAGPGRSRLCRERKSCRSDCSCPLPALGALCWAAAWEQQMLLLWAFGAKGSSPVQGRQQHRDTHPHLALERTERGRKEKGGFKDDQMQTGFIKLPFVLVRRSGP